MNHTTKNKTLAAWFAFIGGQFGLHRIYLRGGKDIGIWLHAVPSALGWWGMARIGQYGQNDQLAWILVPLLGFSFAAGSIAAIYFGLMESGRWNERFNSGCNSKAGQTNWATICAVVFALLVGTIVLMSSIVFSFQRYFEFQVEVQSSSKLSP